MAYIYKITNILNNKLYIGKTERSIEIRWSEHLRHYKSIDTPLYRAMRKYGIEMFTISKYKNTSTIYYRYNWITNYENFN